MGDPAASVSALMATWFTPSSLFIFVNLVIATIVITSRFAAPKRETHDSPQLVRSPSLRDRVRSFKLGHCNHDEPTHAETEWTQPQLVRTPSLLERVKSFKLGLHKDEPAHADQPELENPKLARGPSLLQRLRSMKCSRLYRSDSIHAEKEPDSKMRSETTSLGEEEEGVDAKADDFIDRFKKQLRLQRVDSILRYREKKSTEHGIYMN